MKKLLSLSFLAAVLAVTVGCDDKKSTGGTVKPVTSGSMGGSTSGAGGAGSGTGH